MSTLRVNKLENTNTSNGGISIDTSGHVSIDGANFPTTGPLTNRNLVINGAMQVAQRGTEETGITTSGYRTCDRWRVSVDSLGTWTIQQSTDAPDGYSNSFRLLCTTGDASPAANDHCRIQYRIEAQDLQHLFSDKSAGDTHPITLSFWVKASRLGNASFAIMQSDNSYRQFTDSYNISATDTWERKVISIPADDSAVINNDNGMGLLLEWYLHSGSNFTGGSHAAGWEASTNSNRNASNIGIGQAANDDFLITGVQLEVGEVATPFEHRSYNDELAKCQRYFLRTGAIKLLPLTRYDQGSGSGYSWWQFPVVMNQSPVITNDGNFSSASGYSGTPGSFNITTQGFTIGSNVTISANTTVYLHNGEFFADAEL